MTVQTGYSKDMAQLFLFGYSILGFLGNRSFLYFLVCTIHSTSAAAHLTINKSSFSTIILHEQAILVNNCVDHKWLQTSFQIPDKAHNTYHLWIFDRCTKNRHSLGNGCNLQTRKVGTFLGEKGRLGLY